MSLGPLFRKFVCEFRPSSCKQKPTRFLGKYVAQSLVSSMKATNSNGKDHHLKTGYNSKPSILKPMFSYQAGFTVLLHGCVNLLADSGTEGTKKKTEAITLLGIVLGL